MERSARGGAIPESFHVIVIAPPPVNVVPAAGLVNSTSAEAKPKMVSKMERSKAVGRIMSTSPIGEDGKNRLPQGASEVGELSLRGERAWALESGKWLGIVVVFQEPVDKSRETLFSQSTRIT